MSYILDALRRADAERQLGRAPDLHAQPLPTSVLDKRAGPTPRPLAWFAGGVVALAAGLLAVWWTAAWWRALPTAPDVTLAPPLASSPALSPPAPSPPAAAVASPGSPADVAREPAGDVSTAVAPAPSRATTARSSLPPLPAPSPPSPPSPVPTAPPAPDVAVAMPNGAASPTSAAASMPPAGPVAAAPAVVPSLRERPDLQRELPPIVFGGSVHAEQASARLVVLNGRVFREGETIMPDLVVDEIRPRSAVLRWRGQRFSLP